MQLSGSLRRYIGKGGAIMDDYDKGEHSFEDLVDMFSDMVTRLCYVNLKNYHDVEDCYQNVFLKLWKNPIREKSLLEVKKWLIVVTMNDCKDLKRKIFHRKCEDIDSLIIKTEDHTEYPMLQLVKSLPLNYATVLYLYYFEGYKIKEISIILKKNENTIKSWMKRGKEILKGEIINESME